MPNRPGRSGMAISELLLAALGGGTVAAAYVWWWRPWGKRLAALEAKVAAALPAALDDRAAVLDEVLALVEGSDDPVAALREGVEATRSAAPRSRMIPPPDPGIEYHLIDNRRAIALAKQEFVLGRHRDKLLPHIAAMKWPPGTVFCDAFHDIYVVTRAKPVCIFQNGREVEVVAGVGLAEFDGGAVELLVTVEEMRAGHLIAGDDPPAITPTRTGSKKRKAIG